MMGALSSVSLVVVGHAVDAAVVVHGERHPVQRLGADHAAEAAGMVRVPQGLQDLRRDRTTLSHRYRAGEACGNVLLLLFRIFVVGYFKVFLIDTGFKTKLNL